MNKKFAIGFAFGLILFIAINLAAAHIASDCGLPAVFSRDICADDIARAGWPLRFYEEGGFDYRNTFQGGFLTLDLAIGILFAGTFGWLISRRAK